MADGKVQILVDVNDSELSGLNSDLSKIENSAEGAGRSLKDMFLGSTAANLVTSGISAVGGAIKDLVGDALSASDSIDKFNSTMEFAGFGDEEIKKATASMKDYADKTVYDLGTVANTTAQLAANGIKDYTGLTQAAGNLNAVAGGNAETFKSVGMVLTQTAGAGKLTTENWNQLADAIPGASGKLQEAMKKNGAYTGNFRDAMEKGEITADEFNKAIMDLGMTDAAKEAATSTKTFEGAFGSLEANVISGLNNIIESIGKDNLTSIINDISSAVVWLFETLVTGIQKAIPIIKQIIDFVKENQQIIEALLPVVTAVVAAFVGFSVLSGIFSKVSAAANAVTTPFKLIGSLGKTVSNSSDLIGTSFKLSGANAAAAATNFVKFGAGVLEIGAGIGIAAAGIGVLVLSITQLAASGTSGAIALAGVTIAIGALVAIFALLGPALTASAVGIGVFGASVLAIGAGIGIATLGIAALLTAITGLVTALTGLGASVNLIVPTFAALGVGFSAMITSFIFATVTAIPQLVAAFLSMITQILAQFTLALPQFITMGVTIITTLLSGIAQNIGEVTTLALNIMINFLNALASKLPDLINSAVNLIVNFVNAIAGRIPDIIGSAVNLMVNFLNGLASKLPDFIEAVVNLITTFIRSIADHIGEIVDAGMDLVDAAVQGVIQAQDRLMQAATDLINGFADNIRNNEGQIKDAALNLLDAIIGVFVPDALFEAGKDLISGLWNGISDMMGWLSNNVGNIFGGFVDSVKDFFSIGSPSKLFADEIGEMLPAGVAVGVKANTGEALSALKSMNQQIMKSELRGVTAERFAGIESSRISSNGAVIGTSTQNNETKTIHNEPNITINVHVENAEDIEKTINDINWRDMASLRGAMDT